MIITNKNKNIYYLSFLTLIFFMAIYYRVAGLSLWGFTSADEYYMAKSVRHILKYGLPKFETGGYYTRGILYQYISAFFVVLGFKDVFALRFVAVLANISAIPVVYLLSKKIGGAKVAFATLFLFLFSSWEVEYARFSRYYTLFQSLFLWHMLFIYKVILENKYKYYKWSLLLSLISIFVYEGGIFLVVINFLPFVFRKFNLKRNNLINAFLVLAVSLIYIKTDFRQLSVTNQLPNNFVIPPPIHKGMIYLPKLLIFTTEKLNLWIVGFIILVILTFVVFFSSYKAVNKKIGIALPFGVIFILMLFNQIGLALLLIVIYYLLQWFDIKLFKQQFIYLGIMALFLFGFYSAFMYMSSGWFSLYRGVNHFSLKKIMWALFNYPDIYEQVFLPWVKPLPFVTIIMFGTIVLYFIKVLFSDIKKEKYSENLQYYFYMLILLSLVIGVALIVTPYQVGRYTFFIHPLVIIIFSYSALQLSKLLLRSKVSVGFYFVIIFFTMFISRDYSTTHFLNIKTAKEHFKEGYPKYQATMYYLREDYKTVADYVNKKAKKNDIILLTVAPAEYYLNHVDYYFRDYRDIEFTIRSREGGSKELWTNAKLIYDENQLLSFINNFIKNKTNNSLWLITYSIKRPYVSKIEKALFSYYKKNIVYKNKNQTITIYKLNKNTIRINEEIL